MHTSLCRCGFPACTPMDVFMQLCICMGGELAHVCVRVLIRTPTSLGYYLPAPPSLL